MHGAVRWILIVAFLCTVLSGCIGTPTGRPGAPQADPSMEAPAAPVDAGTWNGTVLTMQVEGIEAPVVRIARLTVPDDVDCQSYFRTEGNVSAPWTFGWAMATYPGGTFSHEFVEQATANGDVGESGLPGSLGADYPQQVHGQSTSTLGPASGGEITYVVAASYPAAPPGTERGWLEFSVSCDPGMTSVETGWSSSAHLLSHLSLNGTWASAELYELDGLANADASATIGTEWVATLPERTTTFIATEPFAGRATLHTPTGEFTCGPSPSIGAIEGNSLCSHDYPGGNTTLEVTQAAIGKGGAAPTRGTWIALLAQMEYHVFPSHR